MRIVYLSRGHGYGHAATDLEVVRELRAAGVHVELASYGTGLTYYRSRDEPCADLRIDDIDDQGVDAALRVLGFLRTRQLTEPRIDLVVAHELFTAPRICTSLGLRDVLLTHWFFTELGVPERDAALRTTSSLVLLDFAAAHDVPPDLVDRSTFTGAVAKPFDVERAEARKTLDVAEHEFVTVLTTGAVTPLNADHLNSVVSRCLRGWPGRGRLFVLTGVPPEGSRDGVEWVGTTKQPELYYAAADLVLANATFSTLSTLARNGVPTIAITGGRNPVDRLHAEFFARQGLIETIEVTAPESAFGTAFGAYEKEKAAVASDLEWATPADVARLLRRYGSETG